MLQFSWLEPSRLGKVSWWWTLHELQYQNSDFKLSTHISNRMLNQNVPAFFLTMINSFFYVNHSTSFESVFCIKTVKSRLFKKHLERRKSQERFCLPISWLHMSVQINYWKLQFCRCRSSKSMKNTLLAVLWPLFFRYSERIKKVNYKYWKKLVLIHVRRYYKNMYMTAFSRFVTYFSFSWITLIWDFKDRRNALKLQTSKNWSLKEPGPSRHQKYA